MRDAIGNIVELNKVYGYSRNQNGFTYVRIGKLVKINKSTVTLEVQSSKESLYGGELIEVKGASKISVKSITLFPV